MLENLKEKGNKFLNNLSSIKSVKSQYEDQCKKYIMRKLSNVNIGEDYYAIVIDSKILQFSELITIKSNDVFFVNEDGIIYVPKPNSLIKKTIEVDFPNGTKKPCEVYLIECDIKKLHLID